MKGGYIDKYIYFPSYKTTKHMKGWWGRMWRVHYSEFTAGGRGVREDQLERVKMSIMASRSKGE